MAFCRNCGNELSGDSKFCNKCGTSTDVAAAPSAPISSGSRNLGAEVSVYYSSEKSRFSSLCSAWVTAGGLVLLLIFSSILPIPGFIKVIVGICLIYSVVSQFVNANHLGNEVLRVCEHGIRGVQRGGFFSMVEFSVPYDEITHVGSVSTGLLFIQYERIIISTRQGAHMLDISYPSTAAAEIEKLSGRTLR